MWAQKSYDWKQKQSNTMTILDEEAYKCSNNMIQMVSLLLLLHLFQLQKICKRQQFGWLNSWDSHQISISQKEHNPYFLFNKDTQAQIANTQANACSAYLSAEKKTIW